VTDYQFLTYELLDEGSIARIFLDRPDVRNGQNRGLLMELNQGFLRAEADDLVEVVIPNSCFTLHELNHSHWAAIHENGMQIGLPEDRVPRWKDAPPIVYAVKEAVRADG